MTTIFELARAFLAIESMSHKKLQKLCYYAKAWYLALYDENLIAEPFEAWVHGPVNRELYERYKKFGHEAITEIITEGDIPDDLFGYAKQVYDAYGHMDGDDLEIVTHREKPWMEARGGKRPWESCDTVISEDAIKSFYKKEYARECAERQIAV